MKKERQTTAHASRCCLKGRITLPDFGGVEMEHRKAALLVAVAVLSVLAVALIPLPAKVDDVIAAQFVVHAINTVVHNKPAWTDRGREPLIDSNFVKKESRLYFVNNLGIPDDVFLAHGMKPPPSRDASDYGSGNVLVVFSVSDDKDTLRFAFIFGPLGAQGYSARVFRSIFFTHFVFKHEWVS